MTHLCISSLVIRTRPSELPRLRSHLARNPDIDVIVEDGGGKLVVVLDTADRRTAESLISQIQDRPGVFSATLVYQFDDQFEPRTEEST